MIRWVESSRQRGSTLPSKRVKTNFPSKRQLFFGWRNIWSIWLLWSVSGSWSRRLGSGKAAATIYRLSSRRTACWGLDCTCTIVAGRNWCGAICCTGRRRKRVTNWPLRQRAGYFCNHIISFPHWWCARMRIKIQIWNWRSDGVGVVLWIVWSCFLCRKLWHLHI